MRGTMKRIGNHGDEHKSSIAGPEATPRLVRAARANPPAVPARLWKGVAICLCLTAAIAYGVITILL